MSSALPGPVVSTTWVFEHLHEPDLVVVDASTDLVAQNGRDANLGRTLHTRAHVPGAGFADLLDELNDSGELLFTAPDPDRFATAAGTLGIGAGRRVVVYDQGGSDHPVPSRSSKWAARLWWQLRLEGFDEVAVLDGGFRAWVDDGLPVAAGPVTVSAATFAGYTRRPELRVDATEVERAIDDPGVLLVDSRAAIAYEGSADRPYRSGHIPGATNVFEGSHSDPVSGRLAPPEVIRDRFAAVGALDPDTRVITYCGGGVSAAQNALALAVVGRYDVAVYDGSMLEWGNDPRRPLATSSSSPVRAGVRGAR